MDTVFGELRSEVLYLNLWRKLPLKRSRDWNKAVLLLNKAIGNKIRERRNSDTNHDDLLGALLTAHDAQGEMQNQQIHDEILTFFLAGHETAALSITWALSLLAAHPDAQERIAEEVAKVTGGTGLTPGHATKLPWTAAVVKEAMRLYPPVWSMGRKTSCDTTLAGQPLREGTDVWICVYQLHRDPRWFDQADRFLPTR